MLNTYVYEQKIQDIHAQLVSIRDVPDKDVERETLLNKFLKYWNFIERYGLTLHHYVDVNGIPHVYVVSNGTNPYIVNITFKNTAKQNRQYLQYNRDRYLERYTGKYYRKYHDYPQGLSLISPYYGERSMTE